MKTINALRYENLGAFILYKSKTKYSNPTYFECSGYEVYSEGYWDSDYEYDYYDPFRIIDILYDIFQIVEDLLFQKQYIESHKLNNRLLNMY